MNYSEKENSSIRPRPGGTSEDRIWSALVVGICLVAAVIIILIRGYNREPQKSVPEEYINISLSDSAHARLLRPDAGRVSKTRLVLVDKDGTLHEQDVKHSFAVGKNGGWDVGIDHLDPDIDIIGVKIVYEGEDHPFVQYVTPQAFDVCGNWESPNPPDVSCKLSGTGEISYWQMTFQ